MMQEEPNRQVKKKKNGPKSGQALLLEWSRSITKEANEQLKKNVQPAMKINDIERCAVVLALRVEARLRSVLSDAKLRMWGRHGEQLNAEDINLALEGRGEERCLGQPIRESRKVGGAHKKNVLLASREIDLKKRLQAAKRGGPMTTPPTEPILTLDWLAIQGKLIDSKVIENQVEEEHVAKVAGVSREHELYVRKVVSAIRDDVSTDDSERRQVLRSLRRDEGLCVVAPALIAFCCAEITAAKKRSIQTLRLAVATMRALAMNSKAKIEPVLHDLLPAALTCVVAKRLGPKNAFDLDLRLDAARCVAQVAIEYGEKYPTLRPRIAKTYTDALQNTEKPLAVKFGAIVGVHALGSLATISLILPRVLSNDFINSIKTNNDHQKACFHALALAIASSHLRPLVLSYSPIIAQYTAQNELPPSKKRRLNPPPSSSNNNHRGTQIDVNQEAGRIYRRRPVSSDILNISDTFGELCVPLCGSPIAAAIFL